MPLSPPLLRSITGLLGLVALLGASGDPPPDDAERVITVLSPTVTLDRPYKSMEGPVRSQQQMLGGGGPPELIWITGFGSTVASADGDEQLPQEYMCHTNLDLSLKTHEAQFAGHTSFRRSRRTKGRLFTISQGQHEVRFPEGFGIPVVTGTELLYVNQALNLRDDGGDREVRYKNELYYLDDPRCDREMTPLHLTYAQVQVAVGENELYEGTLHPSSTQQHATCSPGEAASDEIFTDRVGQSFAYHWILKPGREVRHTLATNQMQIDQDTTLHYIIAHMHPYGESLALRDLTEGRELFRSELETTHEGMVITGLTDFSSAEGIPLYKDHEYEIVSVYDNTSGVDQDAMAILYLYVVDERYQKPESVPACRQAAPPGPTS